MSFVLLRETISPRSQQEAAYSPANWHKLSLLALLLCPVDIARKDSRATGRK